MHEGKTLLYRASKLDCDVCPLKPQCCPKEPSRKIPRDIHEHARTLPGRSLAPMASSNRDVSARRLIGDITPFNYPVGISGCKFGEMPRSIAFATGSLGNTSKISR